MMPRWRWWWGTSGLRHELDPALEGSSGIGVLTVGVDYEDELDAAPPLPDGDSGGAPELMFYTSGTTARPKGVVHGALADRPGRARGMEGQVALWGWTEDEVYVMSGPAYHASHLGWSLCSLYVGGTTVITEQFEARSWLAEVDRHRGTRTFMVPAHFIRILEIPEDERAALDLTSLRLIVHAAAPCPVAVKHRMMEAFPDAEIHELYGASEGGATKITPDEWREKPGSVGRPWPGVEIRILDEEGRGAAGRPGRPGVHPPGGDGAVPVPKRRPRPPTGPGGMTPSRWATSAISTSDGFLYITDRVSDMVLWGGVNIAPREIEEVLFDHPAVVDCAVFGVPDERDGERVEAVVQLRHRCPPTNWPSSWAQRLAKYKIPRHFEVVDEVPRDHNGKVRKRQLGQARAGAAE